MSDSAPPRLHVDHVEHDGTRTRITRVEAMSEAADAPVFVLVPGVGVAATYFEFLAPTLARRGHVVAVDLPGFAGMPRPEAQPTAAYFADHLEAVLDALDLHDPVLIGHSMGSQIVTEVLIRRPHLTHAVLVGPVVDEREATPLRQGIRFAQSAVHEPVHLALTALSAYMLCGVVYFLTVLPHLLRYRLVERIRLVRSDVLLIRGEHDRTSSRRFHSRLVAAAPRAARWEIEDAAHSVISAHAVGVARLTVRHLDGELERRGRMTSDAAELPPPPRADWATALRAVGARAYEWISAVRRHERGVARAKMQHARLLWQAYSPGRGRASAREGDGV